MGEAETPHFDYRSRGTMNDDAAVHPPGFLADPTFLVLYGQGGVGKTSVACAAALAHLWTPLAVQGLSSIVAARSGLGCCHLSGLQLTTLSSGLGEIHPSKSHHVVELDALCANRANRRRSPTGPATTF